MRPRRHDPTRTADLPHLNRRKRQRAPHLAGPPPNLQHVALAGRRDERRVDIRRDARPVPAVVGGDGQAAGPVGQARRHGPVQRPLGVEVAGRDGEPRGEGALGGGDEGDVAEEEVVDGAVLSHGGPVVLEVRQFIRWGACWAGHFTFGGFVSLLVLIFH